MRIIAGTFRGRPLIGPEDDQTTRPITDRVKENLFNKLHTLGVLGYGRAVDVFCGTGSLGLEALSRGAEHCTFVEQDRGAAERLEQNLAALGVAAGASRVSRQSAWLPIWCDGLPEAGVAVAFFDPPYAMAQTEADHQRIGTLLASLRPKLEPGGVVVYRTPAEAAPPPEFPSYDGPASTTYGGMAVHLYQAPLDED